MATKPKNTTPGVVPDALADAPAAVKNIYKKAYNNAIKGNSAGFSGDKGKAHNAAMKAIKMAGWSKDASGKWTKGKGGKPTDGKNPFTKTATVSVEVEKVDEDEGLAFGWAYASEVDGNPVGDHSTEHVPIEELEKGAYLFNQGDRVGGEMHLSKGCSGLVESVVFTAEKYRAMFPWMSDEQVSKATKGWWIGMQVDKANHADVWGKVKSGEYPMFSIHGTAKKQPVEDAGEAPLVSAAKAEIQKAETFSELSDDALAYITLAASSIRTERMEKGIGPNKHGPSIKCPDIYEALRRDGMSKTNAAQISNECWKSPKCKCH